MSVCERPAFKSPSWAAPPTLAPAWQASHDKLAHHCDLSVELRTTIYPDASLPKSEDIERMTREILGHVDAIIREEPEQWFWFNKRWILDPLDA
jgi:lauroyl/myristoyl acyltransferase